MMILTPSVFSILLLLLGCCYRVITTPSIYIHTGYIENIAKLINIYMKNNTSPFRDEPASSDDFKLR